VENLDFVELYFKEKESISKKIDKKLINNLYNLLESTYLNDGTVYLMANGGPAGLLDNAAADLGIHPFVQDDKSLTTEIRRMRVICLTNSSACLTGISNDVGFENVFSEQLKNHLRENTSNYDLLISFSGSGNSINIINAVNYAKKFKVKTVCIGGRDGGKLRKLVDLSIIIPGTSDFPGQTGKNDNNFHIEDFQNSIIHIITGLLKRRVNVS
tara:strand:+ start:5712 stop:6350 length:639 start_codon:yes stop_codon:yes gene_type:complete